MGPSSAEPTLSDTEDAPAAAGAPPLQAFTVVLARSGAAIRVRPGQSILAALREAHIDVSYSCEEGLCGACEVKILDGNPVHRDHVYSAEEHERRSTVMICCAGSRSPRLTLDL
jgi:tetrachlorobenzoquinone reductase